MMTMQAEIPEAVFRQAVQTAEREHISFDQLVAIALAAQVAAWSTRETMEERAKRGSWAKFDAVLAKVPDVEPEPYDKL